MKRTFIVLAILLLCQASQLMAQTNVVYEYATLWLSREYNKPSTAMLILPEGKKEYSCDKCTVATKEQEKEMAPYTIMVHTFVQSERLTYYMNVLGLEGWEYYESIGIEGVNLGYVSYLFRRVKK